MATYRVRSVQHHGDKGVARLRRAREAFSELRGPQDVERRSVEIARLPTVEWKGRTLFAIRCNGMSGKGPHQVNVEEALLWSLIDPRSYLCPFHLNG